MFGDERIAAAMAAEPEIADCLNRIKSSMDVLEQELEQLRELEYEDRLVRAINAMIRCLLAFGDAMDSANFKPGREELRARLLARQHTKELSDLELGHARAIRVAAAYNAGVRLNASGSKDTQMEAALSVAAVLEGLIGDSAADTIKKSIQRFRQKVRGTSVFKLNPDTMTYERFDAERIMLAGLPGKPGRPRKGGGPTG